MPFVEDPPEGFFATANNTPGPEGRRAHSSGLDFLDHYRHQVIVEELASREKWDLAGGGGIQMCVRSIPWREMRDAVLAITDDRASDSADTRPCCASGTATWRPTRPRPPCSSCFCREDGREAGPGQGARSPGSGRSARDRAG